MTNILDAAITKNTAGMGLTIDDDIHVTAMVVMIKRDMPIINVVVVVVVITVKMVTSF